MIESDGDGDGNVVCERAFNVRLSLKLWRRNKIFTTGWRTVRTYLKRR